MNTDNLEIIAKKVQGMGGGELDLTLSAIADNDRNKARGLALALAAQELKGRYVSSDKLVDGNPCIEVDLNPDPTSRQRLVLYTIPSPSSKGAFYVTAFRPGALSQQLSRTWFCNPGFGASQPHGFFSDYLIRLKSAVDHIWTVNLIRGVKQGHISTVPPVSGESRFAAENKI